jgi:aldehyde:ferredoxin oxidoreductase
MFKQYNGKILDVNLSTKRVVKMDFDTEVMRSFLGGQGLAIKILYDEVGPSVEPLSPDNIIIIATGLLTGTAAPTAARTEIMTKSPLTGNIGRGNFGGSWGYRLKQAGFEAVVIRGSSDKPVYLWIDDGMVEVRSAEHLWNRDNWETADILKEALGNDIGVLSIGQAGENLVRFACPVVDYYHAPGRSHAGCVMGAKKLKAIAVRGTKEVAIANPDKYGKAVRKATERIIAHPDWGNEETLRIGWIALVKNSAKAGRVGCRNFQTAAMPPENDLLCAPESIQDYLKDGPEFCHHCRVGRGFGCTLTADVRTGKYAGLKTGAVNFLNLQWIPQAGLNSFPASWKCKELCQRYGIDQVTPIPFAMELFEKGIITKKDTNGVELKWGDEDAVHEIIRKIAFREGFGDVLAEGSVSAARKIGKDAEEHLLVLKGMDILSFEPRAQVMAVNLGTLVCPRGGDDLNTTHVITESFPSWAREKGWTEDEYLRWWVNWLDMPENLKTEIFGVPPSIRALDGSTIEGKAMLVKWYAENVSIYDSLGLCMIPVNQWCALGATHFAELYSGYTGWDTSPQEIQKVGERIFNLIKAYSVRQGFTRKDDEWPERFYKESVPEGPSKGASLPRDKMHRILSEFYEVTGWDKKLGIPTKKKLLELGLDYVADELWLSGKTKR